MDEQLRSDIKGALDEVATIRGEDLPALFDTHDIEPTQLEARAAYYCGFIEGAARALEMTVLELLDALDLDLDRG